MGDQSRRSVAYDSSESTAVRAARAHVEVGKGTLAEREPPRSDGRNPHRAAVAVNRARAHLEALIKANATANHYESCESAFQLRNALREALAASGGAMPAELVDVMKASESALAAAFMPSRAAIDETRETMTREQWNREVAAWRRGGGLTWTQLATPIAAQLGVDAPIHVDNAPHAHGARGLACAGVIHISPDVDPASADGRRILSHELVHVAQSRLPARGTPAEAEREADRLAEGLARGVLFHAPRVGIAARDSFADNGAAAPDAKTPDLDDKAYRQKFANEIGDGVLAYLQSQDIPTGSRFVAFRGPLGAALVDGQGGAALDAKLDAWIGRIKVMDAIHRSRPKGTETMDGKIFDRDDIGPARWFPDVATTIAGLLHAALRTSLDLVVPRYESASVATGLAAETQAKSSIANAPRPRSSDVIANSALDRAVIAALIAYAHFDYLGYRRTYPHETGQLGVTRTVQLTIAPPQNGVYYAVVFAPTDATREEVAKELFGKAESAGEISIVAPPLFGFANGAQLRPRYADMLRGFPGVVLDSAVVDPVAIAASGPMADQLAKNQGQRQPSAATTTSGVVAAIDQSLAILPSIEKSRAAFGAGSHSRVASLDPLRVQLSERRAKTAASTERDALAWAGQAEAQQRILSEVSFGFAQHVKRLDDLTKLCTDATRKYGGFDLPDYVRVAMGNVAEGYVNVCLISSLVSNADAKLIEVEDQAGALPVTFLEGALVSVQRSLDEARDAKHDSDVHASYDVGGMQTREAVLKQRLVALRARAKVDPEGAMAELQQVSTLVQGLQLETELVANLDRIDATWSALDDGIKFIWTGTRGVHNRNKLEDRGDALHGRWKAILTSWRSGEPQRQQQAKRDLEALRNDPELADWLNDVQDALKSARIHKLIGEFAVMIAITIVTAGVGDLVVAGAEGWGLGAGTTALLAGGAEAATFTTLSQVLLDSNHGADHVAYELATNWAIFGVMRRFQAFAEVAKLTKAEAVTGQTLILAATTYAKADLDKYISEGRHLNSDDVKQVALQGMAMAVAMHAIAPAMKPMWKELEGSAYKFATELRANNHMYEALVGRAKALQGTKSFADATDYIAQESAWLKQRLDILDQVEARAKAEAAPGTKTPPSGGIAAKIKMSPGDLATLRADLSAKLKTLTEGALPLTTLEPMAPGLFACPREHIVQVVESLGDVTKKTVDPVTTVATYDVKLKDGGETIKVIEKIDPPPHEALGTDLAPDPDESARRRDRTEPRYSPGREPLHEGGLAGSAFDAYVGEMRTLAKKWDMLSLDQRVAQLEQIANRANHSANLPYVRVERVTLGGSDGSFDFRHWRIELDDALLSNSSKSPGAMNKIANVTLHEARHAEQWFLIARHLLQSGSSVKMINTKTDIPFSTIIAASKAGPMDSALASKAKVYFDSVYGANAGHRAAVFADLDAKQELYIAADANVKELEKNPNASPSDKKLAVQARDVARGDAQRAFEAYQALPEEMDAWNVGDAAGAKLQPSWIQRTFDWLVGRNRPSAARPSPKSAVPLPT